MRRIDPEKERQAIELYRHGKLHGEPMLVDRVAEKLGICPKTVWRILVRTNEPRRRPGSPEKYPKTDFSGDLTEQARILGFIEDCGARKNWRQIEVSTSTTHPAQMRVFDAHFGRYGHIGSTQEYNKKQSSYQYRIWILLNQTFDFLIEYKRNPSKFLAEIANKGNGYDYVGGLAAAESWVGIAFHKGNPLVCLQIGNKNRQLLEFAQKFLGGGIGYSGCVHKLQLYGKEAIEALRKLHITHEEKANAKQLILHHAENGGIGLEALRAYQRLRRKIDDEVHLCTMQARLEYIQRQGRPHRLDPDQTIPSNLTLSSSFYYSIFH